MNEKERETLLEVQGNGQVLVLMDARRLRVNVEHIPTTCLWLPITALELEYDPLGGDVTVTHLADSERITAQWE